MNETEHAVNLKTAWDKVLVLDEQLLRTKERLTQVVEDHDNFRLQFRHQLQVLLHMVD